MAHPYLTGTRASRKGYFKTADYLSNVYRISAVIVAGRAASLCYVKLGGDMVTDEEMQALLDENGDGSSWSGPEAASTTDGALDARLPLRQTHADDLLSGQGQRVLLLLL